MVQQFIQWMKFILLVSLVAFISFLCWGIYKTVQSVKSAQTSINTSTQKLNSVLDDTDKTVLKISSVAGDVDNTVVNLQPKLDLAIDNLDNATEGINTTIAEINKPCAKDNAEDCGTIAYTNKTIKSIRLAVGQVTAVSLKEQGELDAINKQEVQVATDTHTNLLKLGGTLDGLNNFLTVQLPPLTKNITIAAANVDDMTDEGKQELHKILHPSWPVKIVHGIVTVPGQVFVWLLTKI